MKAIVRHTYGPPDVLELEDGAEVTGVCSRANVAMVQSIGAQHIIDYTRQDCAQNGETCVVLFYTVGKAPATRGKKSLNSGGRYGSAAASTRETTRDLMFLKELAEAGALTVVINRRYPLAQAAEAHRYVENRTQTGQYRPDSGSHRHTLNAGYVCWENCR
jgi:NADPH:quinone reductase-like Zn-dependent oxidoreductase